MRSSLPCAAVLLAAASAAAQEWVILPQPGPHPLARSDAWVAYDRDRKVSVLYGGQSYIGTACNDPISCAGTSLGGSTRLADTWEWDGSRWTQIPTTLDPASMPLAAGIMAYDTVRRVTILAGWVGTRYELWQWNGAAWTLAFATFPNQPGIFGAAGTFDTARGVFVVFANSGVFGAPAGVYEWDGAVFSYRGPWPFTHYVHHAVFDEFRGKTVAIAGGVSLTPMSTWLWDGASWTDASTAVAPPTQVAATAAYDSARHAVVFFGAGAAVSTDTWEWDGAQWTLTYPMAPPPGLPNRRFGARLVWHESCRQMLLLGGRYQTSWPPACFGFCTPFTNHYPSDAWQYRGACGPGQANSFAASILINLVHGLTNCGGPHTAALRTGSQATISFYGPPSSPIFLAAGPPNPVHTSLGCAGLAGIGTPPLFADLVLLIDGVTQPAAVVGPNGQAHFLVSLAGWPAGHAADIQAWIPAAPGGACAGRLTAAFAIDVF